MPDTSELDPLTQLFEEQFKLAWKLFKEEYFEQGNAHALRLTMEPAISNLHKAGCHMILANLPDQFVYGTPSRDSSRVAHADQLSQHAEKAVELYKTLYTGKELPNKEQQQSRDNLIRFAGAVLARAKEDAAQYSHEYTEEDIQANIDAFEAQEPEMDAEMDAGMEIEKQGEVDIDVCEEIALQPVGQTDSLPNVLSQPQQFERAKDDEDDLPRLPSPPSGRGVLV
jgi:hypothetical protein